MSPHTDDFEVALNVEVESSRIIISLEQTSFVTVYVRAPDSTGIYNSGFIRDDQDAPISLAQFEAIAWKAANAKARELGWTP